MVFCQLYLGLGSANGERRVNLTSYLIDGAGTQTLGVDLDHKHLSVYYKWLPFYICSLVTDMPGWYC